jgi:Metal-dependent hydrolases of the beta-lactamase superfamily I
MKVRFTILGCGSSLGIPRIDGYFGKCNPNIKENYRSRCSALITFDKINILIDTSPDLKSQLLKNKVKNIDKVFYTHMHGDQTHGINELRVFYLKNKKKLEMFADKSTSKYLIKSFNYCFNNNYGYPAIFNLNKLKKKHIINNKKKKLILEPIKVKHGKIHSLMYKINNSCAYVSDVSKIYFKDLNKLKKLKYLIVDCLRYDYHPSHFNLKNVFELVNIIKPNKTILTNMNNEIDYIEIKKSLPKNIIPAYDGMSFLI